MALKKPRGNTHCFFFFEINNIYGWLFLNEDNFFPLVKYRVYFFTNHMKKKNDLYYVNENSLTFKKKHLFLLKLYFFQILSSNKI